MLQTANISRLSPGLPGIKKSFSPPDSLSLPLIYPKLDPCLPRITIYLSLTYPQIIAPAPHLPQLPVPVPHLPSTYCPSLTGTPCPSLTPTTSPSLTLNSLSIPPLASSSLPLPLTYPNYLSLCLTYPQLTVPHLLELTAPAPLQGWTLTGARSPEATRFLAGQPHLKI